MTRKRNATAGNGGVVLVAFVLVIAIVGVLVGLGRLKMHERAVKRRLDRTYQIEKMLATRDALAIANTGLQGSSGAAFTNRFDCANFGDELEVAVEPVLPVDVQNMDKLANSSDIVWAAFSTSEDAGVEDKDVEGNAVTYNPPMGRNFDGKAFRFFGPMNTNGIAHRVGIIRAAARPWFDNEFGYLYTLRMVSAQEMSDTESNATTDDPDLDLVTYHLGRLRLYLIGLSDVPGKPTPTWNAHDKDGLERIAAQFDDVLACRPWIRMELSVAGKSKYARRRITIHDFQRDVFPPHGRTNDNWRVDVIHNGEGGDRDQFPHAGGFLLSSMAFCAFGEDSRQTKLWSQRWDLTRDCEYGFDAHAFTNAFTESALAVEHVFPTNVPAQAKWDRRTILVDQFVMREPTTYRIRAFNPKVESEKGRDVVTWVFQTKEPAPDEDNVLGKQCILDTFGREPASLVLERKGITPE